MRDHAIVSPHFWTGDTGRQLRKDPEAQRVAFYLMTCPSSNMIGLYYLPIPLICHEVGISEEGASKALASLSEVGFCDYDAPSEVVFVKQMARYQIGETISVKDNRHLGVQRQLAQMRNSRFYKEFLERYNTPFHLNLEPLGSPLKPLQSKGKGKGKDKEKEKDLPPNPPQGGGGGDELEMNATEPDPKPAVVKAEYTHGFLRFWDHYPVKKQKDAAWRAWKTRHAEGEVGQILASVTDHQQHDEQWQRGYIPYPATFLNGGGWKDELHQPADEHPRRKRLVL